MITFTAVTKRFGQDTPALNNLTFQVQKGEFVFLTGPSGSGKSTLLKILTKEYNPTTGEVEFEGTPLSKIKAGKVHHHRRRIGVVFQDYRLLPELNVWENIALALQIIGKKESEIEERVTDLLELVQLTEKAYNFPSQLSGGEAQRVGIARALATAPSVILADEPTGNLDPETTLMIAKLFHKIHQLGTTILFATHDVSVLSSLNHRRLHLEKGQIVNDTGSKHKAPHVASAPHPVAHPPAQAEPKSEAPEPKRKTRVALPKLNISLPFGKKAEPKQEVNPDILEVMIQVEDLEEKKANKKGSPPKAE